jgi:hypothetical protein
VIDYETPFFSDVKGENLLFYLPYTYYVKVIGKSGTMAHIECFGLGDTVKIDGYTYFDNLFFDGQTVADPFLEYKVTTQKTAVLYSTPTLENPVQFIFAERKLNYYGHVKLGDDHYVYCVEYCGVIGYLKESDLYPFYIKNHPNALTFLPPVPSNPDEEKPTKNTAVYFRVIIISCLVLAGILALFISLRKKKPPEITRDFYEDGDYE